MSVINRQDLISDQAFNWPEQYARQLETLAQKSKELGRGSARKGATELERVQNQLAKATERSTGEYIKQRAELDKLNKENREAVKEINSLESEYDQLTRQLQRSRKAYKDLAAAGKANTKEAKELRKEVTRLDNRVKSIDKSVGQSQRNVGNYGNAIKAVTARFIGWTAAIAAVAAALRSGIRIVLNYSKANSTLRAVIGATRKETEALTKQQQELGKATAFSATQVAKAQTEAARLGLTIAEIQNVTPIILDAAVAFGVDLAQATELVVGQLNAFQLQSTEAQRVTDTLVKATQISAFNFSRLEAALGVVSPAAKAVNASIEQTVGVLTAAIDANIDASTAATALRNIYIDLSDQGLTWEEAIVKINSSTDKLSAANELFGKRGAVVATVIAENTDKINENTLALEQAAGAANAFAQTELDNLRGDITLLQSAWEGFVLAVETGEGKIATAFRKTIQGITSGLTTLSNLFEGITQEQAVWIQSLRDSDIATKDIDKNLENLNNQIWDLEDAYETTSNRNKPRIKRQLEDLRFQRKVFMQLQKERIADIENQKKQTDETEDNTEALKENNKELIKKAELIEKLTGFGSPFDLNIDQQNLLSLTEAFFGKNTIDEDAKEFGSKIDEAIRKRGEASEKARKDELAAEAKAAELRNAIIDESLQTAGQIFSNFTDLRIEQIGQEIESLEFQRNRELQLAGENERQKFEINQKFDRQRRDLQRKQANTEKLNSIFQIAINTATGITKSIAQLGLPFATPFIALTAAIGAAQAAAVLAAPIPQFDKGSDYTPKDYIAGEKRPEFRKSKGKWSLVDRPTLFKNSSGDKIVSGKETDSILGTIQDISNNNILNDKHGILSLLNNDLDHKKPKEDLAFQIISSNKELIRTIKNKKSVSLSVNSRVADVNERSGNYVINRKDYYYKRKL